MESNLFIELAEEQQEVVAGGALDLSAIKAALNNGSQFQTLNTASADSFKFGILSSSGANGSTSGLTASYDSANALSQTLTNAFTSLGLG